VADLQGRLEHVEMWDRTTAAIDFRIVGLPEIERTRFTFDVDELSTDVSDASAIMHDLTGKALADNLIVMLSRAGQMHLRGEFDGRLKAFDADAVLKTALGALDARMNMSESATKGQSHFEGDVSTDNFELGTLLAVNKIGRASLNANLHGDMGGGRLKADIDGEVPLFDFNGYRYDSIAMKGRIDNRCFEGYIGSDDHNLEFDFNGVFDFNGSVPRYDFAMQLDRADLHALNFNRRDSISVLGATLSANASGISLDNLNGNVRINSAEYIGMKDTIRTRDMQLRGENSDGSKYVAFS
jgi:hypothetical protein